MSSEVIGWGASAILISTLVRQIYVQARDPDSPAVSKWLFVGQIAASLGFTIYSWLLSNAVFVFTNSCILVTALVGQWITWRRRRST